MSSGWGLQLARDILSETGAPSTYWYRLETLAWDHVSPIYNQSHAMSVIKWVCPLPCDFFLPHSPPISSVQYCPAAFGPFQINSLIL